MANLWQEIINDMYEIMSDMGNPYFTWTGNTYPCIASVSQFRRELEEGGFTTEKLITMTIPQYDTQGNPVFTSNILPTAQQVLSYNGDNYRINSVKLDSINNVLNGVRVNQGTRIRIVGTSTNKGV